MHFDHSYTFRLLRWVSITRMPYDHSNAFRSPDQLIDEWVSFECSNTDIPSAWTEGSQKEYIETSDIPGPSLKDL